MSCLQIGCLQQRQAETATAVEQLSQETDAAKLALLQALQADGTHHTFFCICYVSCNVQVTSVLVDGAAILADSSAKDDAVQPQYSTSANAAHTYQSCGSQGAVTPALA